MEFTQIEIQLIAIFTAVTCSLVGTFLVLRKMAMVSDAISHSILPGIVIGFFVTQKIDSVWLLVFASIFGVFTVILIELIKQSNLVKEDTAIGLVFPSLFSLGVILIALFASDVHLDNDAVLLGELAFAPFNRFVVGGMDVGAKALWVMGIILLIAIGLLVLFFKELKLSTFDTILATTLGFSPLWIHYGLMLFTSITIVGAFDIVGAILVVALIIVPSATAYLLVKDLKRMLFLSSFFGITSSILGYWAAFWLDASIAGAMSTVLGIQFFVVFVFAPDTGWIVNYRKQKAQRKEISLLNLLLHLTNHKEESERHLNHLTEHINWQKTEADKIVKFGLENNFIIVDDQIVNLTERGKQFVEEALNYITGQKDGVLDESKDKFFLFRG